ncbi:Dipeptidyl aminopeptidase/acylaminoacyl peptidase [Jatrophihabitans endophyticus]|uniref:Dipeptidyl aminopeptidase/acylaminoacyl peptidase n=1 Tax=Jatrophihabitans endophyticus TaxID=1206085 RepID=A0A1M5C0E3_9ACTN|nr:S9 family peptidase [Jatrophihabitans endophyticus]SHF48199.1 Dipeptidyl aminopeptidase/acylaminoacyl peptidase [Jatrophihabitans endophyticus]
MSGFATFDEYLAHARVTGLALSPDGARLVATVAELNDDGDAFVTALWDVDPAGERDAVRLTRSAKGESAPAFTAAGDVLFVSGRAAAADDADDDPPALWRLPAAGEAERVLTRPGGVTSTHAAAAADVMVLATSALPGTRGADEDGERRTARRKSGTSAILHTSSPVRYWDHDLGPEEVRLLAWRPTASGEATEPLDLTPEPGRALDEAAFAITPDGRTVVTSWYRRTRPGFPKAALVAIDTTTGEHRVLAEDETAGFESPDVSRDGRWVVCERAGDCTADEPWTRSLWLVDLDSGDGRELIGDPDVQPSAPRFGADADTVFFVADEQGHAPVFRLDVRSGTITRVTASGHHTAVSVTPDGASVFALRDAWDTPPRPVRYDATATDAAPAVLPAPGAATVPGTLHRLSTTAADGAEIGSWLVLPEGASAQRPAPLLLFVHGGPFSSWNGWTWRWNPWLMAARGYAVVLPDPALSTGYGMDQQRRGWGQWGGTPYTDLMSVVDDVVAREDVDGTRTAALGGSYGGYMANWVAGHTDRFRCIVTHASLWNMAQFQGTTDVPGDWALEWGLPETEPQRYTEYSPSTYADEIHTPMLVIHGDKDYRVPVGEAQRLWWDLQRRGVESAYLYFPDEGHWILKPGNARVWYETVWAWLAHHLLGEPWVQPSLV